MNSQPNILFLMSDQHNAGSMGCAGHPNVKTPTLDALAEDGIRFTRAYCNNPICSPSRITYVTGQYPHTHGFLGNNNFELDDRNPDTLGATFRRQGYQTAQVGKAHMIRRWDEEAYEFIRYCDLCDADRNDPTRHHYFKHLIDCGLADDYDEGTQAPGSEGRSKGCAISKLPYEHSIEHFTGEESLRFLETWDQRRPFFLHMSFQRPHPPWHPSAEHADMYDPADIQLGPDAADWWENKWAGRPEFITRSITNRMRNRSMDDLKKMLAYHFALVSVIDMEMGRVVDWLKANGQYENTIIIYAADHGDFAGDHGTCDKNVGIYESIHRIPFIIRCPGGPRGESRDAIIESVDLFPTLCDLAGVPRPEQMDGRSISPEIAGQGDRKPEAICEWDFGGTQRRANAIRTQQYRLVYYTHELGGELYDHETDPFEMYNRWECPEHQPVRLKLMERLFDRINQYRRRTNMDTDLEAHARESNSPTHLLHKRCKKWSEVQSLIQHQ